MNRKLKQAIEVAMIFQELDEKQIKLDIKSRQKFREYLGEKQP